jgi:hypothetical protein
MKADIKKIFPRNKVKVSIFTIGTQKGGTSALHDYLIKHPKVIGGIKKELNFFSHPELYEKGDNWYHQQYKSTLFFKANSLYIDSTPQYLSTEGVAKKIYSYNPNAKIVVLLREPVSRAFSAWNMYKQFSEMKQEQKQSLIQTHVVEKNKDLFNKLINQNPFPSFDEYVDLEFFNGTLSNTFPNIIYRGLYVDQIKPYLDFFGPDNVLIFESDFFKKNKLEVTNLVLNAVGLSNLKLEKNQLKPVHSRTYNSTITSTAKETLKAFYKPHNDRLFNLIDQKFNW